MNVKKYFVSATILLAGASLVAGCSQAAQEAGADATPAEVPITRSEMASSGQERFVATLSIEGMGCEMMCGSKISSTLKGIAGVNSTHIDFKGEGELSYAVVEYDAAVTDEQTMINAVNGLANGHYKVKAMQITHYRSSTNTTGGSDDEEDDKALSLRSSLGYRMPNIFSVFRFLM
jgi:copper chaperone CopZ